MKSVLELGVNTGQWDAGLKKAGSALNNFVKANGGLQQALQKDDEKIASFVQMMGKMESTATTAKGRMNDYKRTIEQLTEQYNRMDAAQQKAIGTKYTSTIDQLTAKYRAASAEVQKLNESLGANAGPGGLGASMEGMSEALSELAGKFGVNLRVLTKWGAAVAAAAGVVKVATDAFKQNDEMLDDWNATVEAAGSVYDGFLNALNTGDYSGFFQNIRNIVRAAQDAYAALDQLGTFNAFNQIQIEAARTGFQESIVNFREGTGTRSDVMAAADRLKNELASRQQMEQDAYTAAIRKLAESRNVDADLLQKALSGTYGDFEALKATKMPTKSVYNSSTRSFVDQVDYDSATIEQKLGDMLRRLNDEELSRLQALGAQAQRTATEIAQIDRQALRFTSERKTATGGGTQKELTALQEVQKQITDLSNEALTADETRREEIRQQIAALQQQEAEYKKILDYVKGINQETEPRTYDVTFAGPEQSPFEALQQSIRIKQADQSAMVDTNSLTTLMTVAMQNGIDSLNPDFAALQAKMAEGMDIPEDVWEDIEDKLNAHLKALNIEPIKLDVSTGALKTASEDVGRLSNEWIGAAHAVSMFGSALQSVEDPTAKIAGIIAQAIASVAAGAGSAIAEAGSGSAGGPWGWLAFAISATATMVSTIAAIKVATSSGHYAQGGIIPGNSFSGDNLMANVNSGELILNRAQQDSIAGQLTQNPLGNLRLEAYLHGETIRLALANNDRAHGGSRGAYAIATSRT